MIVIQPRSPPENHTAGGWIAHDRRKGVAGTASKKKPLSKRNTKAKKSKAKAVDINPVLETAEFAYKATNLVQINDEGVKTAARYIKTKLSVDSYTPCTWRTHPLHICPDDSADIVHPKNKRVLDWIFLISTLNFSFWSERTSKDDVYGVEWRSSWDARATKTEGEHVVWTGYWSLVAALDRALADDHIPIIDPKFYSSTTLCPDSLIEHVFRSAEPREQLPLMKERIAMMRGVGKRLCDDFNGSFLHFIESFYQKHDKKGTALDLVKMVTDTFPEFRDESIVDGRKVYIWKRAQILVAETWAAFHPPSTTTAVRHPIFPHGSQIHLLTMFADYRVPQILHHLRILSYPPSLLDILHRGEDLPSGCREEVSLRTASIVAVERVRREMVRMAKENKREQGEEEISSVLIDFYLWDLAKRIEDGEDKVDGIETAEMAPTHRTRCVWY
ncbi:hypothetical protein M378DRAFT_187437 [Amanita muscaria Koide BX008]|uniref:Queuosine 5'-phosphate N-glycosylase/hydrolase n=1 Tax=Amanita muscaria (strain Koide BX008) TaxID=946122 RepID=A0A0C2SG29_AMAMK|nr:hypothetical protein M378DRAFT_187437 [Amanita muscaria Koide BX008]